MKKLDYLFKHYENTLGWYKQSEEKGKFLVTINTLVVGVVNGLVFIGADKVRNIQSLYTKPIWLLLTVAGAALICSYLFILRAMWPRHHTRDTSLKASEQIWFFGDVASLSKDEYKAVLANWTEEDLKSTLIVQNHILSKNVWTKHEALNWAIAFTITALILIFILGVVYGIAVANIPMRSADGIGG
jgi:hypothetical protein